MDNRKIALMILDGWGHGPNKNLTQYFLQELHLLTLYIAQL